MLKKLWFYWKSFAHALGVVNTFLLLTVTYVLLIGPVSLGLRVLGRDVLHKRAFRKGTRWIEKKEEDTDSLETYTHPF